MLACHPTLPPEGLERPSQAMSVPTEHEQDVCAIEARMLLTIGRPAGRTLRSSSEDAAHAAPGNATWSGLLAQEADSGHRVQGAGAFADDSPVGGDQGAAAPSANAQAAQRNASDPRQLGEPRTVTLGRRRR